MVWIGCVSRHAQRRVKYLDCGTVQRSACLASGVLRLRQEGSGVPENDHEERSV